jgi:hypothetical protein
MLQKSFTCRKEACPPFGNFIAVQGVALQWFSLLTIAMSE